MTHTVDVKVALPEFDLCILRRLLQSNAQRLDGDTMLEYWQACQPWLNMRGYKVFERRRIYDALEDHTPPANSTSAPLPYGQPARAERPPAAGSSPRPWLAFGEDEQHRDVVLKLVENDTTEFRIYSRLLNRHEFSSEATFPCVLPPVAILSTPYPFSFVVTPRWGDCTVFHKFTVFSELLNYMRCTLRGLTFLHSLRVAHRDIYPTNIMHRWFDPNNPAADLPVSERGIGGSVYCIMDYDMSLLHDDALDVASYFRPIEESWVGDAWHHPFDYAQAEWRYNPFAFDVACLGRSFTSIYACAIPAVPLLAPLFDKMTTHVVSERFTAAEALDFVEYIASSSSADDLQVGIKAQTSVYVDNISAYWEQLPSDFLAEWSKFRQPPVPLITHLLRTICRYETCWNIVHFIRRSLRI